MKRKLKRKEPERLDVHLRRALRRAEHIRDYVLQERDRFRHGSVSEAYREEVARKLKGHRKEYAAAASKIHGRRSFAISRPEDSERRSC